MNDTKTFLYRWMLAVSLLSAPSWCGAMLTTAIGADATDDDARMRFFESQVRPLLAQACWSCHGESKQKGSLRLDSLSAVLRGGESGAPALVPGHPENSVLIDAVRYGNLEMPPSKKLRDDQVAVLVKWVADGAYWPENDVDAATSTVRETFSEQDRQWWAFQPVLSSSIPSHPESSWPINAIDNFVLQALNSRQLSPAPPADKLSLVRRVYFDVTGLPPTPEQVSEFLADQSPDAYERLVDSLLDSPGYGEHVARAWLDLVRYADSDGYRADGFRPQAWRYRDYVIESFNQDKPYDRFVQEQLAADELFPEDPEAQIGLGYLRHWVYEWNLRDAEGQWKTILDDVTDTTSDVFLGLGLQCAKCHDHKFDPLLQKDYFRLRAYFAPLMPVDVALATPEEVTAYEQELGQWNSAAAAILSEIESIEAPYRERLSQTAINRFPEEVKAMVRKPETKQSAYEKQIGYLVGRQVIDEFKGLEGAMTPDHKDRVLELRRELAALPMTRPAELAQAMVVTDVNGDPPPNRMSRNSDEDVVPGIPSILDPAPAPIERPANNSTTGRRSTLARWLTDPNNPLTTRVIVNRIWQSHFGRGLAVNPSDFGRLGEAPTHPELLDWLAHQFVVDGWSLKSLHRLILLCATYRQSTAHPAQETCQSIDPANQYYWRANSRRLTAEQIRDALLAVSGRLDATATGPSRLPDSTARTIYTRVMRNSPDELLDGFDLPLFFSSTATRNTTTTPVQSLLLINSDLMLGHARSLAETVTRDADDLAGRVESAWKRVYGRSPEPSELTRSLEFIQSQTGRVEVLQSGTANSLIETGKLPYRDGQAVRFSPSGPELELTVAHDETLNTSDFTIEAFFQLRSIDSGAAVRTIAGKWNGNASNPGWAFAVTGKGSRRKPQTLVLQLVGHEATKNLESEDSESSDLQRPVESAIFSDQHIEINKPYYASASVRLATADREGSVRFCLKDLSNDDEPLGTSEVNHQIMGGFANSLPLRIGGLMAAWPRSFDGLIDDVRLVNRAVPVEELLYVAEKQVDGVIGYWQFEFHPGMLENSVSDKRTIQALGKSVLQLAPAETAMVDFCHALLNSSEFLYVH